MRILALLAALAATAFFTQAAAQQITVIDGDTVSVGNTVYRLVGFDAPETVRAKCASEYELGQRATQRLQAILRTGLPDLKEVRCSCRPEKLGTRKCNFGRRCGKLSVKGEDVGDILIREGLARPFHCGQHSCPRRKGWCGPN